MFYKTQTNEVVKITETSNGYVFSSNMLTGEDSVLIGTTKEWNEEEYEFLGYSISDKEVQEAMDKILKQK